MQTPLEFLHLFRTELRAAGIRFAITSGMACVRYGLQQTTKDNAARDHGLPPAPLAGDVRHELYAAGCADAAVLANLEPEQLAEIAPPLEEVLP